MAAENNGKTVKNKILEKRKKKPMIIIDLDPLMTNMTVFRLSVKYFAVKITEITEFFYISVSAIPHTRFW